MSWIFHEHLNSCAFGANPGTFNTNSSNLEISGQEEYLEDETILLTCVDLIPVENSVCVFDNCTPINWIFDGKPIDTTSRNVLLNDSILIVTSTLQIPNVNQSNAGVYTCSLTIRDQVVVSRRLSLIVYG